MATDDDDRRGADERVDQLAKNAGAALRRPAPADGIARVRSSRRRRHTTRAVVGGTAVVLLGAGLYVALDRDSDDPGVVSDPAHVSVPETIATTPQLAPPTSEPTSTSAPVPTTTTPPTTALPSTGSGWQPTEPFPPLAFDACCGLNWEGDPSPTVAGDPATPLAAGIYNARLLTADPSGDDFADGILTLEVRPYTRCSELPAPSCTDPPYEPTELGVADEAARTVDVVLDDTVRVGVHGFACQDGQLQLDVQAATGADLAALVTELDAAYQTAVGDPLRSGVDPEQLAAELAANPSSGFADPGCPSYTNFAWTPSSGPGILTFLNLFTMDGYTSPDPLPSPAAAFLRPTALSVDEGGVYTLYLFAGFQS